MKFRIISFLIITTVCLGGIMFYLYQKPSDKTVSGESAFIVDASIIFNEFNENESLANQKYLNQVITVNGEIADMSAVDSLGVNIILSTGNPLFGVSCQLPFGNGETPLSIGDQISIQGLCTGKLMDVVLIKCLIENKKI